jgi:tRNA threonylcarbamoyladenosine dehydratase
MEETTTVKIEEIFEPSFYRLDTAADKINFERLIDEEGGVKVFDHLESQLKELVKCLNPASKLSPDDYEPLINEHLHGRSLNDYGVWVYYPWSNHLIHILDEEEFIKVRTNRNCLKITPEEQATLKTKKIGIVGLSVGQSIALTLAMERTCGEIRLADFDTAELSNLNRLRTGLHNLGLNKTVIAAREIAEIDPFIKIKVFNDGLNADNMNTFFTEGGNIDLLVEVCDGLDIKIESRLKARALKIPVVMDTNDRGMLDVERFDLEPGRSIFHGLIDGFLDVDGKTVAPTANKMQMLMSLVSFEQASDRLKLSMTEIGKTITTWPQLASSVVLGGAITTDLSRRILLDQHSESGRYYADMDEIIAFNRLQ